MAGMVFLKQNGASFSSELYPKLALVLPGLKLQDLRGEFIRGWDDGRGVDTGRSLLSWQKGTLVGAKDDNDAGVDVSYMSQSNNVDYGSDIIPANEYAQNYLWYATMTTANGAQRVAAPLSTRFFSVTRPRNIAFNYIVRAA